MPSDLTPFIKIDNAFAIYYLRMGQLNYRNVDGDGIFLKHIVEEELNDDDMSIETELGDECDPNQCMYCWEMKEDKKFPIPRYLLVDNLNDHQREALFFYVAQHCWKYNRCPSHKDLRNMLQHKINAILAAIFTSKPTTDDFWNHVVYNLIGCDAAEMIHYQQLIHQCRKQRLKIHELQTDKMEKFQEAVNSAQQRIRGNKIKRSDHEYQVNFIKWAKIMKNIQTICRSPNDKQVDFQDELLNRLCVSFDFNDILRISDTLSMVMCVAINYGENDVLQHSCFEQIFNNFVPYEFQHYLYDELEFVEHFEAIKVIQRKRFLASAGYSLMIERFQSEHEDDGKIGLNVRTTQIFILSFVVSILRYLYNQRLSTICNIALDIKSLQILSEEEETKDPTSEIDKNICALNKALEAQQKEFNDNMRKHSIAYCTVNASKMECKQNDIINVKFVGRTKNDIGISLDENEYDTHYSDNHLFHVIRTKKELTHTVGISIHIFGDTVKMYWHYNGSVIPLTLKDVCVSEWWISSFNSHENALNDEIWIEKMAPFLKERFMEYKMGNNCKNVLDNTQNMKYISFIKRLATYSPLFGHIYKLECDESTMCTGIATFASKYSSNIELTITNEVIMGLSVDIEESKSFENESLLEAYVDIVASQKLDTSEMIAFNYEKQQKAIFTLELHEKKANDLLYGIMEKADYEIEHKLDHWEINEYGTSTEIKRLYPGLDKIKMLRTASMIGQNNVNPIDYWIGNEKEKKKEINAPKQLDEPDGSDDDQKNDIDTDDTNGSSGRISYQSLMDTDTNSDPSSDEEKYAEQVNDDNILASYDVPINLPSLVLDYGAALYPRPILQQLGKYDIYGSARYRGLVYSWEERRYYYHYEREYFRLFSSNNIHIQHRIEASSVLWILYLCMLYKRTESDELLKRSFDNLGVGRKD